MVRFRIVIPAEGPFARFDPVVSARTESHLLVATPTVKRVTRSKRAVLTAALAACLLASPTAIAHAQPQIGSATDAQTRLADLSRESEQTTEALHNAQIDLDAKTAAQRDAEASVDTHRVALQAAEDALAQLKPAIDKVANVNYQGGRTNRLFAVMVSDSPQQLLDQMSALDVISAETARQVEQFKQATSDARTAEQAAEQAADAARTAAEQAKMVSDDLQAKQSELQSQMADVMAAYGALSSDQQAELAGTPLPPGFDLNKILQNLVPGSGIAALQAGMTQIGKPYVWGATGPDGFDCSGLVVWAYKQVGKTLPRSSQAQAQGGTPVDQKDLQPGDVVLFYPDASHVGLYAGNGNVLHASTFGVPVKVQSMASFPFYGARRY
ncbi:C40 family peptidase [Rhodococcus sp. BP-252]|nr:C40 family peptidase [Rhodococcus sp. BP-320]MBY6416046.1 C40 family peptidase [Rhodococcus sp. BP-321]MBY6420445.1 C40 family peptidase [Rhodococcus sp. BP-324]MBY6426253.1 C40 family peptidase [Rhodococcus sp. BP-323]MBY6431206.1 C40 family peptidase [Rhodococcus sp. BP-322]MBY6440466.1 C40 family peptidase [Rhodococcus sp. BP-319]MBY6445089.1 C40 family peptidase [Rhodococcus sp. BP-318]MBY6450139.1 C40 family peptidase [Rhodococcus sp. BP-315]MBY6455226.1 C40 family peptidase [Rhodoc